MSVQQMIERAGSQAKLAKLAKVDRSAVCNWLAGRSKPGLKTLMRLERAGLIKASEIRPELFV